MEKVIGIGGIGFSDNPKDTLKTYALASCVAVTAYSHRKNAAGMVHIVLPSPLDQSCEKSKPYYYANLGVPMLIHIMGRQYDCSISELEVSVYGGAQSVRLEDRFKIGRKNIHAVLNILCEIGVNIKVIDTGGLVSRTIQMDVASGKIQVTTQPIKI